jgi:hypothetical protein
MPKNFLILVSTCLVLASASGEAWRNAPHPSFQGFGQSGNRVLPAKVYLDKMKGGWIGQMVGVALGGPTEFTSEGSIMPARRIPSWKADMINQFEQDDLYVEMTFLRSLEVEGFGVTSRQAGIDFANSGYELWHANKFGRLNLRRGIAPPDSGHPQFNKHADDIDYQIEADFSGLISPGLPNTVIALGEKFGRLMNYGDGLYGGHFIGGMYAAAFFESDPERIVREGLKCIPSGSQYHECISDVVKWHRQHPGDWEKTWHLIEAKYQDDPGHRLFSCSHAPDTFNIDAKINGAYVVMGLLYGGGDLEKTATVSIRCGQDSDCNPASAMGILCSSKGYSHLPKRYSEALDQDQKFSHTEYSFPRLIAVCDKLGRQAVIRSGGRIERNWQGEEVFIIPVQKPRLSPLEQSWKPGPIAGSKYTEDEMKKITADKG